MIIPTLMFWATHLQSHFHNHRHNLNQWFSKSVAIDASSGSLQVYRIRNWRWSPLIRVLTRPPGARWFWCPLNYELALKLNVLNPTVYFSLPIIITSAFLSIDYSHLNLLTSKSWSHLCSFSVLVMTSSGFVTKVFLEI